MSVAEIVTSFRGPLSKPMLSVEHLKARVSAAESRLAEVETRRGELALDQANGVPGASESLADLNREVAKTNEEVTNLRAAHQAAVVRDAKRLRDQQKALRASQVASVKSHLTARDTHADAFTKALTETVRLYQAMLDRSAKAKAAWPAGEEWPLGLHCEPDSLHQLVTYEIYRLCAKPGGRGDPRTLPGSAIPALEYDFNPTAIKPLADEVKKASAQALKKLGGD